MRIGIISCSGGSTFIESRAAMLAHVDDPPTFHVVTDRACVLESKCDESGIDWTRIENHDNASFSDHAGRLLVDELGVDGVILFFHRIVERGVCGRVPTLNIHPSLLPAYRGFSPLKRALADGVSEFGATLHLATDDVDAGPILAQVTQPMPADADLEQLQRLSFLHKACLFMLACEAQATGRLVVDLANQSAALPGESSGSVSPGFATDSYRQAFIALQQAQDIEGLAIQV